MFVSSSKLKELCYIHGLLSPDNINFWLSQILKYMCFMISRYSFLRNIEDVEYSVADTYCCYYCD